MMGSHIARTLLRTVVVLALAYAVLGVVARTTGVIDRYFIFFPERTVSRDPGDRGLDFEDVYFAASDGVRLNGWLVPGRSDTTLLWLHGNAGNIANRVDNIAEVHRALGVNVFIFDYRGYGRSEGSPSEKGTYLDAAAALEYLRSREDVDPERLVLFGRSLGCAVAAELASQVRVQGVILESPFTSIQAMAKRAYPFLPGIGSFVRTRYDTLSKVTSIRAPVMVLHGDRDDIAPFDMGVAVFEAASSPKRFYRIEGAGHNDTYAVGGDPYYSALGEFLDSLPAGDG
jgi:fermentation-respiration switch protein FrsA (DUF1100 family)